MTNSGLSTVGNQESSIETYAVLLRMNFLMIIEEKYVLKKHVNKLFESPAKLEFG